MADDTDRELELALRAVRLSDCSAAFAVGAMASLGIADRLAAGARSSAAVASAAGLEPRAVGRLLRALSAWGLVTETDRGMFTLAEAGRLLTATHAWTLRDAYALMPADARAWAELGYSIRTGASAFEHAHGVTLWRYLADHPTAAEQFDGSMQALSRLEAVWLIDAYDWSRFRLLADVGGGNGSFLNAILEEFHEIEGVLFDLPHVVARAVVPERCRVESGSFFDAVPAGCDGYVLKRIIYSYEEEQARTILRRVRAAMADDARVLLIEPVGRSGAGSEYSRLLDLQMLVVGGGRVRERHALRELLQSAGLRLRRIIPTPMSSIIEATPE